MFADANGVVRESVTNEQGGAEVAPPCSFVFAARTEPVTTAAGLHARAASTTEDTCET